MDSIFLFAARHFGVLQSAKVVNSSQMLGRLSRLEAAIERGLEPVAAIGAIDSGVIDIQLVSIQEQPQLLFPEQGTLWLLRIEMDVTGQNLTEPMRIVGQAHYTFEDTAQFSLSRQEAYAQAVSQISEQLSTSLSYQRQTKSDSAD